MFDRSAHERSAPPRESAVSLVIVEDRFGVDGARLVTTPGGGEIFLGRLNDAPIFISHTAVEPGDCTLVTFREALAALEPDHVSLLSYAKGMLEWTRRTRFCGTCGSALESRQGGHVRFCAPCETEIYPRTDPAVMMLVTHRGRILLAQHKGRGHGFWSTLAGFVEPGESLEEAARRELFEETGIVARELRYFGSQSWPLPASLMIGFVMEAENDDLTIDENELADARWYTVEELDSITLSGPISLSRWMIESWRTSVLIR
jgi:NAD+ diphosphatase